MMSWFNDKFFEEVVSSRLEMERVYKQFSFPAGGGGGTAESRDDAGGARRH